MARFLHGVLRRLGLRARDKVFGGACLLHALVVALLYAFVLRAVSDARVRRHGGVVDSRDPGRLDAWAACAAST